MAWLAEPQSVLLPIAVASTIALAIASTIAARRLVLSLHPDVLGAEPAPLSRTRAALRMAAGIALVALGVALLFLPGPGVFVIVLGLLVCAPAWRRRIVRALVARPRVLREINALRRRHGRAELVIPA